MTDLQTEIDLSALRGLVATANLTGSVHYETMDALLKLALHNAKIGLTQVEYRTFPAQLVEAGRDAILHHALNPRGDGSEKPYDYVLMFDGDATFGPDALLRLLKTAYVEAPDADVVSAYAQLKHPLSLPCIDTGTGTWEPIFPGEGVLPAMRVGGHFLLIKTSALRRFGPPWFRTRRTLKPVDALSEVDNFARIKFDGSNPLQESAAWRTLHRVAREEAHAQGVASVGEDSGFCDALLAAGGSIYVNTDVVTGHLTKRVISPSDLKSAMEGEARKRRLTVGVYE